MKPVFLFTILICCFGLICGCEPLTVNDEKLAELPENLDEEKLIWEKVKISQPVSDIIENLIIDIQLPEKHKLLLKAKSNIQLITKNQGLIEVYPINTVKQSFKVNQSIENHTLFAQMDLYYCREGIEGLCLIKNILFEIPIDKTVSNKDLNIRYKVEEIIF